MAKHPYEIPINEETAEEDLHRCVLAAERTSDTNVHRAAAKATVELARRERAQLLVQLEQESQERIAAQRFQEKLAKQQDQAIAKQTKLAGSASRAAWAAAIFAAAAAVATGVIAVLTSLDYFNRTGGAS